MRPTLEQLRERGMHEFAFSLEVGFKDYNWFSTDRPLEMLGFLDSKIPFKTNQTIRQIGSDIFIYRGECSVYRSSMGRYSYFLPLEKFRNFKMRLDKVCDEDATTTLSYSNDPQYVMNLVNSSPGYDRLEDPQLKRTAILQELLERIMGAKVNTNDSISNVSVALAADLLAQDTLPPKQELQDKLRKLGFETKNNVKMETIAIPTDTVVPVDRHRLHEVINECTIGNDSRSITQQTLRQLFPSLEHNHADNLIYMETKYPYVLESSTQYQNCKNNLAPRDCKTIFRLFFESKMIPNIDTFLIDTTLSLNNKAPEPTRLSLIHSAKLLFPRIRVANDLGPDSKNETILAHDLFIRRLDTLPELNFEMDREIWEGNGIYPLVLRAHQKSSESNPDEKEVQININIHDYVACLQEKISAASLEKAPNIKAGKVITDSSKAKQGELPSSEPNTKKQEQEKAD